MCPLCRSEQVYVFAEIRSAVYFRCSLCHLTFLAHEQRLAPADELERYKTHQNDPADRGYRDFLSRLADPMVAHLPPSANGLDYGCGPGPTLSVMLEEQGFKMKIYDPFFAPDPDVLNDSYDFITCSETVEHFYRPSEEFDRLDRMLRPGGWLGVMTEILQPDCDFTQWYYVRDPTHVCFYQNQTMRWIAQRYDWKPYFPHRNVVLFQKSPPDQRNHSDSK